MVFNMADYDFLLLEWQMNKITAAQVDNAVTKGYITAAQATTIKATPKSV